MFVVLARRQPGKGKEQRNSRKHTSYDQEQTVDIRDRCLFRGGTANRPKQKYAEYDRPEGRCQRIDAACQVQPVTSSRRITQGNCKRLRRRLLEGKPQRN